MEKIRAKDIYEQWKEYKDKEFVTVENVLKKLDEIEYKLHHDSSVTCWEELAEEFREELVGD